MDYTPEKAVREAMEEVEAKKADKPKGRMMPPMEIEGKPPETETKIEVDGREVLDDEPPETETKIEVEGREIPDTGLSEYFEGKRKDAERLEADLEGNELVRTLRDAGDEDTTMDWLQDDLGIDPQADREEQVKQAVEWLYDNKASNKEMQTMFSALSLYNDGRASWDSVLEAAAAVKSENPNTKERPAGEYKGPQAAPEE